MVINDFVEEAVRRCDSSTILIFTSMTAYCLTYYGGMFLAWPCRRPQNMVEFRSGDHHKLIGQLKASSSGTSGSDDRAVVA